jgi:hypothetical protein
LLKLERDYRPNDPDFRVSRRFEEVGGLDLLEELQRNSN